MGVRRYVTIHANADDDDDGDGKGGLSAGAINSQHDQWPCAWAC